MNKIQKSNDKGFTLVELSIVIVIIGFLIAGITAGTNLIKQAELRSVINDFQGFSTSFNNFLGRYRAIPGDFSQGDTFFTGCSGTAACNGDGDGDIETAGAAPKEVALAWIHLDQAGMLNSGVAASADAISLVLGSTVPPSKVSGAGYMLAGSSVTGQPFAGSGKNAVVLGRENIDATTPANDLMVTATISPEDAFGIDQKIDDARVNGSSFEGATSGTVRAVAGTGVTATNCQSAGAYAYTTAGDQCIIAQSLD